MRRALALVFTLWAAPLLVHAQAVPNFPYFVQSVFPEKPTAVTVDVVELPTGPQIANNLAASQVLVDGVTSGIWQFNLDSIATFAEDCEERFYSVVFSPDGANCNTSPQMCTHQEVRAGGPACRVGIPDRETVFYPTTTIPSRGITSEVIAAGNPSYIKHDLSFNGAFDPIVLTYYDIFFYDSAGRLERRQASPSAPNP